MPKLTLDSLSELREKIKKDQNLSRGGPNRIKVTIHMGTCGIASGARGIMEIFLDELEKSGLHDVFLTTSGCAGMCSHEPMVTIESADSSPVKYIDLNKDKARTIFRSHVVNNNPVKAFALASGSERAI